MFKTAICAGGCLLLTCAVLWGLIEVVTRPTAIYLPTRVQPYGLSSFMTLPRYGIGGYSLGKDTDGMLKPFPDLSAHVQGFIGNAVDIHLDSTGHLWVLDSGWIDTLQTPHKLNDARIQAIDADSGKIERVISLKDLVKGRVQNMCVDEDARGARYLYISDGKARTIIVWDLKEDRGHRVVLPDRVIPHPIKSKVLYLALVGQKLYFTYFGSFELFRIDAKGLISDGRVERVGRKDPRMIILGVYQKKIIFRLAGENKVFSWDTSKPLQKGNLELEDEGKGELNPMAAVPNFGKLWILDSNVKTFLNGSQPEHNFRPAAVRPPLNLTDIDKLNEI